MRALDGNSILILDSRIDQFIADLQTGMREAGAVSAVARDVDSALESMGEFDFTAVLASIDHAGIKEKVDLPVLLYQSDERDASNVLSRLTRRLCSS